MIDLNKLAKQTFDNCIRRGRIKPQMSHKEITMGIMSELLEFNIASERKTSEHLSEYTEAQEELADILICCLTELYRRDVDVEQIVMAKIEFNENRTK